MKDLQSHPVNTKSELVEMFQLGLAVVEQSPNDPAAVDEVNSILQTKLASSPLYGQHSALEEINDELLGFEDLEAVLTDPNKVQSAIVDWRGYVKTVPARLDTILP